MHTGARQEGVVPRAVHFGIEDEATGAFDAVAGARAEILPAADGRGQRLPAFDDLMPYPLAYIQLDDAPGVTLLTNLPGAKVEEVKSGLPVDVEFEEITPGTLIPQFHIVKG